MVPWGGDTLYDLDLEAKVQVSIGVQKDIGNAPPAVSELGRRGIRISRPYIGLIQNCLGSRVQSASWHCT